MKQFVIALFMVAACGGGSSKPDGRVIVGDVDAPPSGDECNIKTNTGCDAGERCGWVRLQSTETLAKGKAACVPVGNVAEEGQCTWGATGETTGFDNCAAGLYCLADANVSGSMGRCKKLCDTAVADSCGEFGNCINYIDQLELVGQDTAVAGLCNPTCNPLTQKLDTNGADRCGDGTVAPADPILGCYGFASDDANPSKFSCAGAGTREIDSVFPGDETFLNICKPGAIALYLDGPGSMNVRCQAFCDPVNTNSSAATNAGGMSPYSCGDLGHAGAFECRYLWFFEGANTPVTANSDAYGLCWNYSVFQYDTNNDGMPDAPWPSCTTMTALGADGMGTGPDAAVGWGCMDTASFPAKSAVAPARAAHGVRVAPSHLNVQ